MTRLLIIVLLVSLAGSGCEDGVLTRDEARAALNESSLSTQVYRLATVVASSTHTLEGDTPEEEAAALRSWWHEQVDCGVVGGENTSVSVIFNAEGCEWAQRTWTGEIALVVLPTTGQERQISGTFTQVSTGILAVNGTVSVAWALDTGVGTITHGLTWSDGHNGRVSEGECSVSFTEGGEVTRLSGQRTWDGDTGPWSLVLEETAVRGADPVPETGRYKVESPVAGALNLDFERKGESSLAVTVAGPGHVYKFTVITPTGL